MSKIINAVDLFCGAGGISTGLSMAANAFGKDLHLTAVNHWERAIETHAANHPDANHFCTSMGDVKPSKAVPDGKLDLLVASPECTHHSIARGGKPYDDQSRASAWHVLHWCQELYIRNLIMENVPEFTDWGPLGANKKPLKSKKGQTFIAFLRALKSLGYSVDWKMLTCANYGDATTRKRFFLLAKRGRKRIDWPAATHFRESGEDMFGETQKQWVPARDIIDWNLPGHSIFLDQEQVKKYKVRIKRPLAANTLRRIETGIRKYWGEWAQPFLVMMYNTNDARSLERPLPTAMTVNHMGLCQPFLVRYNGNHSGKADGNTRTQSPRDPISTLDTSNRFGLCQPFVTILKGRSEVRSTGDALPTLTTNPHLYLCEPFIIPQHSGGAPRSVSSPLSTICTESRGISLVSPFIIQASHSARPDRVKDIETPLSTIVGKPDHYLVDPFIVKYYGAGSGAAPIDKPLGAITTDDRFGLVRPMLVEIGDQKYLLDILFRMLSPKELAAAHSFPEDYYFAGNKSEIVRQIGNSVPVKTSENLCKIQLAA